MSKEIKEKIDQLRWEMECACEPGVFTLNRKMSEINNQIIALQKQCKHNYVEGQCEFCYQLEGNDE
jgi:hypothetical protein